MADILLLTDAGAHGHRATRPKRVPIETVVAKLTPFAKEYYDVPPDFRGDGDHDGQFRHVVVHVREEETNAVFPDEGYYRIPGLTPEDCRELFGTG